MHLGNKALFKILFSSLCALVISLGLFASPAYAASNDIVAKFTSDTLGTLIIIGSLVSVIFLIRGGYLYIASNGDPDTLDKGKKAIRNALIGLVLIIGASVFSSILNNAFTTPTNGANPTQIALKPIEPVKPAGGLTQVLLDAVNEFLQNIVISATKPILDGIMSFLTNTPSVVTNSVIFNYWLIMLGIVDSLFALVIALLGFQLMSGSVFGFDEIEFKHILPRVGLAFLGANMSIFLVDWIIQIANTLVNAVIHSTGGLDKAWILNSIDFAKFITNPDQAASQAILITFIFGLMFVILCIVLLFMYVSRLILVAFGAVMSPFIFLLWALPKTEGIAEVLVRTYIVTVFIIFVHVVLIQLSSAFLALPGQSGTNSLTSVIIAIGLLFTLIKIPQWLMFSVALSFRTGTFQKVGGQIMNILSSSKGSNSGNDNSQKGEVKTPRKTIKP